VPHPFDWTLIAIIAATAGMSGLMLATALGY